LVGLNTALALRAAPTVWLRCRLVGGLRIGEMRAVGKDPETPGESILATLEVA